MAIYKLIGKRNLRKYTEAKTSPTYAAAIEAQFIVDSLCGIPWKKVAARDATMTYHTEETVAEIGGQKINGLEMNVRIRDEFDAALFCAGHSGGQHRAYANAAVYHYVLPDVTLPKLTKLTANVTSDPYNSAGARIAILTNATGEIPTNCSDCRTGDAHADGVAPRTVAANGNWLPTMADCVFSAIPGEGETALPSGGLQLQKHLFVFVLMESYSTVRGNWLEGCSFIRNLISIETDAAVSGWTDGETYDLSGHAERSFAVVSGGVMAAMPSGDSGVRALTIQRTGDDFVRNRVASDTGLFGRPRVDGLRVLDVTSTDAVFREPILATAAKDVQVFPTTGYIVNSSSTASLALGTIVGDFTDGTFSDLPGLYVYKVNDGTYSVVKLGQSLADHAAGAHSTALANLKAQIEAAGGIGCAGIVTAFGVSPREWHISIAPKGRIAFAASSGIVGTSIVVTFGGNCWESEISSLSVYANTPTEEPGLFVVPYRGRVGAYETTCDAYFSHDADARTITAVCARETGLKGRSVSYVGTVTAIRPINFTTDLKTPAFVVSGQLQSVGGVACANCAIVYFQAFGAAQVIVPDCDAVITPDVYKDFAVSCPVTFTPSVSTFYVTGGFTRLGAADVSMAARVTGTTASQITVADGTRPPEYFLVSNAAGSDLGAVWIDDSGAVETTETASDVYVAPKAAVTDAQAAFGLRRLYADLYGGRVPSATVPATARPGAAFVVRGDEITVRTADGDVAAKCWNMSASVLVVPFSCPRAFLASRVRLDWPSVAATEGAKVTVWLLRGEYLRAYPTSYPKGLSTGEAQSVAGWELVGTVEPTGGSAGSATLDVDPIEDDVATLMFVAFIGQDDINPSDGMTLPRGVGSLNVNAVAGTATGLDGGFRPDITLIG